MRRGSVLTACLVLLPLLLQATPAAAIAYRSSAAAHSSDSSITTGTVLKPTGTAQHDVMLAVLTAEKGSGLTITAPTSWSLVRRTNQGTDVAQAVYVKVAGASEPSSYTWTFSQAVKVSGGILTYQGVDTATPVAASSGQGSAGSASITAPAVTTTRANSILVGLFGIEKKDSVAPPTGMTERFDTDTLSGENTYNSEAAELLLAAAGSSGAKVATAASSGKNVGQLVALNPPTVAFTQAASSAGESAGSVQLGVSLSGASSLATTATYSVTGGTATGAGVDFTLASGTVTIPAGATSANIAVALANDALDENAETVVVTLASPSNGVLGTATVHTLTINDDDPAPTVSFGSATSSAFEAGGTVTLPVSLSVPSGLAATVNYAASGGTATGGGTDYTLAAGTLSFPAGATSANVPLTLVNDVLDESDETVVIALSSPTNAALGATPSLTFTVLDDDEPVLVSFAGGSSSGPESVSSVALPVELSRSQPVATTVQYAVTGGDATGGGADYTLAAGTLTIAAGLTAGNILLAVANDAEYEPTESLTVTLSAPTNALLGAVTSHTYTILDDDILARVDVAALPVAADGTPAASAAWGGWTAQPGASDVGSNYLKVTNTGTVANVTALVDFTDAAFLGATDPTSAIPIDGNVQFAWWEDTTPSTTAPAEGTFAPLPTSPTGSATIRFSATQNIIYIQYRLLALPEILDAQTYTASFTVTEV